MQSSTTLISCSVIHGPAMYIVSNLRLPSLFQWSRGNADDLCAGADIPDDHRPGANYGVSPPPNARKSAGPAAYPPAGVDLNRAPHRCAGPDPHAIRKHALMIAARSRIDDALAPYTRFSENGGARHDLHSF